MSKFEKVLEKINNNPKSVSFKEIDKILLYYGFEKRQPKKGSCHYIYKKNKVC